MIELWTDGSASPNPGPGGFAVIEMVNGSAKPVVLGNEKNSTNIRMEGKAMIAAIKYANGRECEIHSDSEFWINVLTKWASGWKKNGWKRKDGELKNPELIKELYELCQYHDVKWMKVKGHADNEYNNRCDELAVAQSLKYKAGVSDDTQSVSNISDREKTKIVAQEVRDKEYSGELFEKIISTEKKFEGRVFTAEVSVVELPDGNTSTREIIRHNGGAAIVAIDDDKNIFLVRQYRISTDQELLEIPAGKLEKGEDPLKCAIRELEEETGMIAGNVKHLFTMYATPGYCSERLHIYLATDLKPGKIHRDEEEFLHVIKMPFDVAHKMVMNGQFFDAKTISGILVAKNLLF